MGVLDPEFTLIDVIFCEKELKDVEVADDGTDGLNVPDAIVGMLKFCPRIPLVIFNSLGLILNYLNNYY